LVTYIDFDDGDDDSDEGYGDAMMMMIGR